MALVVPELRVSCPPPDQPPAASVARSNQGWIAGGEGRADLCAGFDWQAFAADGGGGGVAWEVKLPEGVDEDEWRLTPAESDADAVLAIDFEPHMAPYMMMPHAHFPMYESACIL